MCSAHASFAMFLVAHDLSEASRRALAQARKLQLSLGAEVSVVHVLAPDLSDEGSVEKTAGSTGRTRYRSTVRRHLERSIHGVFGSEVKDVPQTITEGPAVEQILAAQRERDADLIVVGASRKVGVTRLLLGSVARGLLRASRVPVLSMPAQGE